MRRDARLRLPPAAGPCLRTPWQAALLAACGAVAILALPGCGGSGAERAETDGGAGPPPPDGTPGVFSEVSGQAGLDFVYFNGMSGELYIAETMGGGGAFFDYDNDGDLDLYLAQGEMLGPKPVEAATLPPREPLPLTDRLFRNDLEAGADGRPRLRFTDVTGAAGLPTGGYGIGVASGDYDNDGWTDLYVTQLGSNRLLRNRGDGSFVDVTAATGTDDPRWSAAAVFFDFDRDGWLDLYVGNYVEFRIATHKLCTTDGGAPDYCGPLAYPAERDRLFHNRGDGTFEEVSRRAGLGSEPGSTLGAVAADYDGDGWPDLYVANDELPNQLWINQGDGTFRNEALLAGCALNREGRAQASMGVDAADFDNDGDEDLFMAHLARETNTLYLNDGSGLFDDATASTGLGAPSWDSTGFGTAFLDYDNDGWLDVMVVNGAVRVLEERRQAGDPYPLRQPNQLFRNRGDGTFEEATALAGPAFLEAHVSRGAAFGDVDNDGDTDALVVNNSGPVRLLRNEVGSDSSWLGLRLVGASGRDMLGARAGLFRTGEKTLWRRVRTAGSYAAASDPRLLFGLGNRPPGVKMTVEKVRVEWPGGRVEEWTDVVAGRYTTLVEGSGEALTD